MRLTRFPALLLAALILVALAARQPAQSEAPPQFPDMIGVGQPLALYLPLVRQGQRPTPTFPVPPTLRPTTTPSATPTTSVVGTIERVSERVAGGSASGASYAPDLSAQGRWLAFVSDAADLVAGDSNEAADLMLRDLQTGETRRVAVGLGGQQPNAGSQWVDISADGSLLGFESAASNLVAGDSNASWDVFVLGRQSGEIERVNNTPSNAESAMGASRPSLSADGSVVAFDALAADLVPGDGNFGADVFVRDRLAGHTQRVSRSTTGGDPDGASTRASVSADGRQIAFQSAATNLVADDDNGALDIFVSDRITGITRRVSISDAGQQANSSSFAPSVSGDGRVVAFCSAADNLVPGDSNGQVDVFVRDLSAGRTTRVSVSSEGIQANGASDRPVLSFDGRYVAFSSRARNLAPGADGISHIFLHDRSLGRTRCVTCAASDGVGGSYWPTISGDGRSIAFASDGTLLVPNDDNAASDVFIYRW